MLKTEMRNTNTTHIDKMSTVEMLNAISNENFNAVKAVENEIPNIAKAVEVAAKSVENGGRVFYVGCGTSGRLGVVDAAECPPTFGVPASMFIGIIAGGDRCMRIAAEGEEDSSKQGVADLKQHNPTAKDTVVGISVAGGANYVVSAMEYAKSVGAATVAITSNSGSRVDKTADISICADTGPEPITGSTRMKAGTAQKLILNMISTCALIKQGYVYENLMINLKPTNIKLKNRVIRIVCELSQKNENEAEKALDKCDWDIRKAVDSIKFE